MCCLTLEDGTNKLFQNVGKQLPIYAVWHLTLEDGTNKLFQNVGK